MSQNLCNEYQVLLLDDMAIFHKASEIYADLKQKGLPIQDADIFIPHSAGKIIKYLFKPKDQVYSK